MSMLMRNRGKPRNSFGPHWHFWNFASALVTPGIAYFVSKRMERDLDERRRLKVEAGDDQVSLGISMSKRSKVTQYVSEPGPQSDLQRPVEERKPVEKVTPPAVDSSVLTAAIAPRVAERLNAVELRLQQLEHERVAIRAERIGRRLWTLAELVENNQRSTNNDNININSNDNSSSNSNNNNSSNSNSNSSSTAETLNNNNVEEEINTPETDDALPVVTWTSWAWGLPGALGRSLYGSNQQQQQQRKAGDDK